MRREILKIDDNGRAEMRVLVDSDATDALNAQERLLRGKGFTQGRTMRKLANIDPEELNALCMNMDKDALDFVASGYSDKKSLKRLLVRFPAWRCSEGGI